MIPKGSTDSEQAVLGAILFSPVAFPQVADILEADDFYHTPHQLIYNGMSNLFALGEPIDLVTLSEWLNDASVLAEVGGRDYLMELVLNVSTAENAAYYAKIVHKAAMKRRVYLVGLEIAEEAQEAEDALERAQAKILSLAQRAELKAEKTTKELTESALAHLREQITNRRFITGLSSGYPALDGLTKGLNKSKLMILAARPAMGKTGLALNIALNVAINEQKPVLFFSLEMDPEEIAERALISLAESNSNLPELERAALRVPDNLRIIDRPKLTPLQLRAAIIRQKLELKEIGLVVVDYLGLMSGPGNSIYERVSGISRELKLICREFKIPLIALSQLSRDVETRDDKRPVLKDLRDSGSIEQDADLVMFLYRDDYYKRQSDKPGIAEVIIAKNRGGSTGTAELLFRQGIVTFYPKSGDIVAF